MPLEKLEVRPYGLARVFSLESPENQLVYL